jgi:preprotein translocase subunit SecF
MEIFQKTSIDFIGRRHVLLGLSLCIIAGGLAAIAVKGFNYSIEFTGGTLLQVAFPKPVAVADLRSRLARAGIKPEIQTVTSAGEKSSYILREKGEEQGLASEADRIMKVLSESFPDNAPILERKDFVGPVVGKDLKRRTYWAIFLSLLCIIIYIAYRFSNPLWGVAGVLALFHDIVGTAGLFALLGKEMDLLIVTAMLTIAGYSINDTIIVFDRMRENLRVKRGANFADIVNSSVNETLSRTIITVLTTQIVCCVLFFLGGAVLRDFALALIVGGLLGTYSSIACASSLIYEWETRFGGRKAAEEPAQERAGKPGKKQK